jgi:hypothetical protein
MSAWTCRSSDDKAAVKIVPPRPRIPCWKGLGADSEEKHEPASDIDTAVMDSLKVLDPERPIREADIAGGRVEVPGIPATDIGPDRRAGIRGCQFCHSLGGSRLLCFGGYATQVLNGSHAAA